LPQRRRRRGTYRSRLANTVTGGFGFGLGLTNCVADHLSRGRGTSCSGRVAVAASSYLIAFLPVCSKTTRSAGTGRGPGEKAACLTCMRGPGSFSRVSPAAGGAGPPAHAG
jgi:hypothetical protein